jgi:hypothetical protein
MNLRPYGFPGTKPHRKKAFFNWGRCPQTPGIYRIPARMTVLFLGRLAPPRHAGVRHRIPAAGSALRSHPCVALSSDQVKPV